jgi:two-component system OmpR family sensor kinase/two-component system sensor histidine kinase BaeS
MPQNETVRSIQKRLFIILLRAFATVVSITLIIVLSTTLLTLAYSPQSPISNRLSITSRLETYYLLNGSWDGVEILAEALMNDEFIKWQNTILLDSENRIVSENGQILEDIRYYETEDRSFTIPIEINNQTVGTLVLTSTDFPSRGFFAFAGLIPVFIVSIFLAILTTVTGLFLTRSVVTPLAEVIAAAQEVAKGKLDTRVNIKGPDDLRMLSDSFNQMAVTLERSEQERREMLADIAHELRTPLTVLRGRLEGILDGIYTADEKHISPALASTYLLEHLVEDLRLLTMAETRQLQFDNKEVDLVALIRRTLEMFEPEAQEKQISLSLEHNIAEAVVTLDPQRTEQIIGNLLNNALRFVPNGGRIWINLQSASDQTTITINDNGPGVSATDLPFIFNRFWRKEKSRSRASGGTGLGLAISKQLVEAQGGSIDAGNNETGGLSIKILFRNL